MTYKIKNTQENKNTTSLWYTFWRKQKSQLITNNQELTTIIPAINRIIILAAALIMANFSLATPLEQDCCKKQLECQSTPFLFKTHHIDHLLYLAQSASENGDNELAIQYYEQTLKLDPHNKASILGIEQVYAKKLSYDQEAYNETREHMLWLAEKQWERPTNLLSQKRTTDTSGCEQEMRSTDAMIVKLNAIIIPQIDFEDISLNEALDILKQKSKELDSDTAKKGINIFLKNPPPLSTTEIENTTPGSGVTLQLHHVPLYVALDYLAKQKKLKLRIDPYAVSLLPLSEVTETLVTKEYQVPPSFIPTEEIEASSTSSLLEKNVSGKPSSRLPSRHYAQDYLQSQGIDFPEGASANYFPSCSKLVVRNTQENNDLIDTLVKAAMKATPCQVSIETKFIEIDQNNLDQLGFSWLLGSFQIGNSGVYGSGGGKCNEFNTAACPFPTTGMSPIGNLRSGNEAVNDNSLNSVIASGPNGTTDSRSAPGIFSIAGIYSNTQFQVILRALNQKKGIDLMAAPHVTTKNGTKAVIKIIDEFIYPTQYTPPQIPQSTTNSSHSGLHHTPPTITPAFPTAWTTKNLGVILEAKPTIGPDGYTINLELHPQITDFDGFINYGTPINTVGYSFSATNVSMVPFSETLTTNTINQPVFSIREVNTSVTVCDGQTIVLGGLIREDTQKTEDKIPFLGDIPIAGRLFRSKATIKAKKNLIIFVTPKILKN
ncbi:MAG TPA: hypothetical protein VJK54_01990 [Chthoniobacterales bacterium]|nr:hypothetical protein [Chthoniobacterales bacterium]